jgi:hypothetical protein
MPLLLDGEARLFVVPEEVPTPPAARRRGAPATRPARPAQAAVQPALAPVRAPAASAAAGPAAPAAPAAAAAAGPAAPPAPATPAAASPAARAAPAAPVASPAPASVPQPATWAGEHGRGGTLDDLLMATWDGLASASAPVACPVCDGELVRRWSAGAGVVGGRCRDCGSELS